MPDPYSDLDTDFQPSEQQPERRAIENLELMFEHLLSQPASLPWDGFSYHTHQVASSSSTSYGDQESLILADNQPGRTTEKRGYPRISGSSALKDQAVATTKKQRTASAQTHRSLTQIVQLIDSAERDFKRFNTQKAKDKLDTVSTLLTDVSHATSAALMARFRYCILFSEIYHDLGQIDIAQQHVTEARSLLMRPAFVRSDHQRRLSETALLIQQSALSMTESTIAVIQQDVLVVTQKPIPVRQLLPLALVELDILGIAGSDPLRANVLLHLGGACFSAGFLVDGIRYWEQLCAIPRFDANEYKRLSNIITVCQILLQLQQNKLHTVNYLEKAKKWITQYLPNFYPAVFLGQISLSLAYALLYETNVYEDTQEEASHALSIFAEACFPESHPWVRCSKRIYITIEWLKAMAQVKDGQFILSEQTLDSETCKALTDALISPHCHIDKLWIKSCHIDYDDLINLVEVFNDTRCHITRFILENHDIEKHDGIKTFTVEERHTEKNDKVKLLDALMRSNLIELYLHACKLNDNDSEKLQQTLLEHNGRMTTLSLNDNNIGFDGAISLALTLIQENCKLTKVGLRNNNIDDRGICALAKALMHENCKLTHLGLAENYIGNKGIKALAEALKSPHCQLTMLDLRNMRLNDECLQLLFSAIAHPNCKLVHLKIGGISPLTKASLMALAEALKSPHCQLTALDLVGMEFDDECWQALFSAIVHPNCKLVHLKINGNALTKASLIALTDTLKHPHCRLPSLELTFPAAFEQAIVDAIQVNDSLTEVSGLNHFSLPACQQIEAYCVRNRRNLMQKNTSLAQHLGHWATFFDSPTNVDASAAPEPPLPDDEVTTTETQADNVTGTSACSLVP